MTSAAFRTLFDSLGLEWLSSNRYTPVHLAAPDVRRTPYYRRNRREFQALAERYGAVLAGGPAMPELDIRLVGGILGRGLFTVEAIRSGGLIGEYTGIVRPARSGRPLPGGGFSSDYAWGFPKVRIFGRSLEIDAREAGGPLRFANHPSAGEPNAEPEHFAPKGRWRIVFVARRDIDAGEEITVDYGEAYWGTGDRELN